MKNKLLAVCLLALVTIISACSNKNSTNEASPVDEKIYEDAVSTDNAELCKTIENQDLENECLGIIDGNKLTKQAVLEGKLEKCAEIKNSQLKESCEIQVRAGLENANKDAEIEKQLEKESLEASDIKAEAIEAKDPDLCNKIPDENRKYACRYEILVNQAIQSKDPSLCKKIGNKAQEEICQQNSRT